MSRQVFPKLQTRNCHTNKTVHVTIYLNFHVFITFTGIVAKKKKLLLKSGFFALINLGKIVLIEHHIHI